MNNLLLQACLIIQPYTESLYFVGGCVRDMLLNKNPHDFDIALDGDLDKIAEVLLDNGWKINEAGKNFFVLIASKFDHNTNKLFSIEIALFRKDGTYEDGRRPSQVNAGTIYDDAERRDFTINSLYFDPFEDRIIDPTGKGIKDIQNKLIRFNGSPNERIKEDGLRVIRMYRFSASLGFSIDPMALRIARRHFNEIYSNLPAERVRLELEKLIPNET